MKDNLKHYRLSVSRVFPVTHPRKGEETYFVREIHSAINCNDTCFGECNMCHLRYFKDCKKLHTIRANYPLWEKRMNEVQAGKAVIELFFWSGSPYNSKHDGSKQVVLATLDKASGCGVQKLEFSASGLIGMIKIDDDFPENTNGGYPISELAMNDGLSLEDFNAWFKGYDLSKPLAIIQFTKFRY